MEKAWAIIIDDDQAACMMAIPRLFEQLLWPLPLQSTQQRPVTGYCS
ncbi:hypothetical protein [Endozoicomonas atrinae]